MMGLMGRFSGLSISFSINKLAKKSQMPVNVESVQVKVSPLRNNDSVNAPTTT